jgi:hypothetical protein
LLFLSRLDVLITDNSVPDCASLLVVSTQRTQCHCARRMFFVLQALLEPCDYMDGSIYNRCSSWIPDWISPTKPQSHPRETPDQKLPTYLTVTLSFRSNFIHLQKHKMSYRSPSVYSDFDENEVYYDGGVSSSRSRHGSSSRPRSTLYGNGLGEFPYRSRKDSSSRSGGLGTLLESSYSPPRRESSRSRRSSRRETSPPRYSSRRETSPPRHSSRCERSRRRSSSRRESTSNRRLGELGLPSSSRYSSSRRETSPPRYSSRRDSSSRSRLGELGLPSSSRSSDKYSSSRRRESTSDRYGSSSRYDSSRDRYRYY